MRKLVAGLGLMAVASCATTPAPYVHSGVRAPAPPQSQSTIYAAAPRVYAASQLFACNGGGGSNIGEIGLSGEALTYTPYMLTDAGYLLRAPAEGVCLASGFGWRPSSGRQHSGLDLANPNGGFVYAAGDGWVASAEWRGAYGLLLEIDHGAGVRTRYAHLNEVDAALAPGVFVSAGQPVARMGMTGNASGIHLHYEVSVDGLLVDPLHYGAPPPSEPIG